MHVKQKKKKKKKRKKSNVELLILWHLYTSLLTNFAVNYSDVQMKIAFLSSFALRPQGGAPSYGMKFCKRL